MIQQIVVIKEMYTDKYFKKGHLVFTVIQCFF